MRYFYLLDQAVKKYCIFKHHPWQEDLGDYPTKHHTITIHQHVLPWYIHMQDLPGLLPHAMKSSPWKGCAETLGDPYLRQVPLPRIHNYCDQQARNKPPKKYYTDTFRAPSKYPVDTSPTILSIKPKQKHTVAAQLNKLAPWLTGGIHMQHMYMKSPPQ